MRNKLKVLTGMILLMFSISSVSAMAAEKKSEAAGEEAGLLKEFYLSSGSIHTPKENFAPLTDETINLVFVPRNDNPVRITESRWYDPNDEEFRTVRVTYDRSMETKNGVERPKGGSTRVHSMPTRELCDHKPGLWKVALYIDNQLAGRQTFSVNTSSPISGDSEKKDEPPPLPPIEETMPPLMMKSDYFKSFPWEVLTKPGKDGNDPDTTFYTIRDGDTLDKVAETQMGNPNLAGGLAAYNDLTPSGAQVAPGDKIVIPNPIIGMKSEIMVESKGQKEFTSQPFDQDLRPGEEYKLRFEPNVNGYAYILRQGLKGIELLYPASSPEMKLGEEKGDKQAKQKRPAVSDWGKVVAHQVIEVPAGKKGFAYDRKQMGDRIIVFLSLRKIPYFDELRDKTKVKWEDMENIMNAVRMGEVFSEGPLHLLRICDPSEILGFVLNING